MFQQAVELRRTPTRNRTAADESCYYFIVDLISYEPVAVNTADFTPDYVSNVRVKPRRLFRTFRNKTIEFRLKCSHCNLWALVSIDYKLQ